MNERGKVTITEFDAEKSRLLFLKMISSHTKSHFKRRGILAGDPPELQEFGVIAIWQGQSDVLITLRPEQKISYQVAQERKSLHLKKEEQLQLPLTTEGLRILNPKTKRQVLINLYDPYNPTYGLPDGAYAGTPWDFIQGQIHWPHR